MERFVSTFTNKIDAKGRVSVPAPFRTALAKDGFGGIYCYPSLEDQALDCGGQKLLDTIHDLLDELGPYSDERDHLAMALFGASEIISIDAEGRINVPERLREAAGIESQITFVGLGDKFQMWEPARFNARFTAGRDKVKELRKLLGKSQRARAQGDTEGPRE